MGVSNKPEDPDAAAPVGEGGRYHDAVASLWRGALGRTVRCVPTRRTIAARVDDTWLFGKLRRGARAARAAAAEWHWLHVMPLLGLRVPQPIAWIGRGGRSLLVTAALRGRALDAWAVDAADSGWLDALVDYACAHVAPQVRRLHDCGLAYRDLYWNHVWCEDPRAGTPPLFLDVERVFQPRWRRRRWLVKDLAGLWATVPVELPKHAAVRFLRAYFGEPLAPHRALLAAIERKAERIRRHEPRYG
jgi:hypothetical protein